MATGSRVNRRVSAAIGVILLISAGGFLWFRYELSHLQFHFSKGSKADLERLVAVIKASAANVTVIKRPATPTLLTGGGAHSEQNLQAGAKFSDAWQGAIAMGSSTLTHACAGNWVQSSLAANY